MKLIGVVILATLGVAALGQTTTITVSDASVQGSPITFRGTVSWQPQISADCEITGHNNSSKTIAAWWATTNGVKTDGLPYVSPILHDHFWKADSMIAMMEPAGQDFDAGVLCPLFNSKSSDGPGTSSPSLALACTFVQFTDGTWWGDPAAASEVAWQRQDAITFLQGLSKLSATALAATIAKEPSGQSLTTSAHHSGEMYIAWKYLSEDATPAAVAADVQQRLAIAQKHNGWLTALQ